MVYRDTPEAAGSQALAAFAPPAQPARRTPGPPGPGRFLGVYLLALALFFSATILSLAPAAAADPIAWVIPSCQRVRPDAPAGTTAEIALYAARGEQESFQIAVAGPASGVRVTPPSSPLGLRLYREQYVLVTKGTTSYASQLNKPEPPGYFPDGLIPFDAPGGTIPKAIPCDIEAGKVQPFWIDIVVPSDAAPGEYDLPFVVSDSGGETTLLVRLKVWAFSLPRSPALRSALLYWGENRDARQPAEVLLDHRLMPYSVNPADEPAFVDQYGLNATRTGFWAKANKTEGTMDDPPTADKLEAEVSIHDPAVWLYNYTADEISSYPALFDGVKEWGRALHAAGIDQLITMPPNAALFDDGSGTGRSAVDVWVELPKQYSADLVGQALAKGDKVWSYNCLNQDGYSPKWILDYGQPNFRLQPGMLNWQLGMTGILYWRVDYWGSAPWTSGQNYSLSGFPGEGMWVYPGVDIGLPAGTVVPSIRLKWLRDGVDDYDYLTLLKQAGLADWARGKITPVAQDWKIWSRDPAAIEAVRVQLGEKLDSLVAPPDTVSVECSASPSVVASAGQTNLTATAADSLGHAIASWSWSDGGAGGAFSPSPSVQDPTYQAPANLGGGDLVVALTVAATCDGDPAVSASDSVALTVQPAEHSLLVTASADPDTVASQGITALLASAVDSRGDAIAAWSWSDGGAGGAFSPSASVQDPTYQAPANSTDADRVITLTVTAACDGPAPVGGSASAALTVRPASHVLTVSAHAEPASVASEGAVSLTASVVDSHNHAVALFSWSDGGAGGSFSPSSSAQNPTYLAPANTTDSDLAVTLTVTVTCAGPTPISVSASTALAVTPAPHVLTVTAQADPGSVASAGSVSLTATVVDSHDHAVALFSWSDGGAGGSFSPSSSAQNPTYLAPANTTDSDLAVTLTVTVTCAGPTPISVSDSAAIAVTAVPHSFTVTVYPANPDEVPSEGTTTLSAAVSDNHGHGVGSWRWDDAGAGGTFSPSADAQNPTYRAPRNSDKQGKKVLLTVTASCDCSEPASDSDATTVTVYPGDHVVTVTPSASPVIVSWSGKVYLSATATDTLGHGIASWCWSDGGAYGSFSPSPNVQSPVYRPPRNFTREQRLLTLSVTATCDGPEPASGSADVTLAVEPKPNLRLAKESALGGGDGSDGLARFADLPADHWALSQIEACAAAGIVLGCADGAYHPDWPVDRAAMAAYLSRALAGGDANVPAAAGQVSFSDVPAYHWAHKYVEYAKAAGIVFGFPDGLYRPDRTVSRAEMAAFMARAIADPTGEDGLRGYQPPAAPTFPDVPIDSWAYRYVEYLAARGIVSGYPDGAYRPSAPCTRDQMAAYLVRGFDLAIPPDSAF